MNSFLRSSALALAASAVYVTTPTAAKAYQVDCAILLCLSGGWPASAECAHARAVFIRRITPWPIEPPLQIWRCPMGVAYGSAATPSQQLLDFAFKDAPPVMQSYPDDDHYFDTDQQRSLNNPQPVSALLDTSSTPEITIADLHTDAGDFDALKFLELAQDKADIDISGADFDFVRSIRVYDVNIRDRRNRDGCEHRASIRIGTYGSQGEFSWQSTSNRTVVPAAFGPTSSGCRTIRAVFVDWRDFENNYGSERVDY